MPDSLAGSSGSGRTAASSEGADDDYSHSAGNPRPAQDSPAPGEVSGDVQPGEAIFSAYRVRPVTCSLVSWKPDRAVWSVETGARRLAVKAVRALPARMAFYTAAHDHLARHKRPRLVPRLLRTRDRRPFVVHGDLCYTALEWVDGRPPDLLDPVDLAETAGFAADLHLASRKFFAPLGSDSRNYLDSWPALYNDLLISLLSYVTTSGGRSRKPADEAIARFRALYPRLERQALAAIRILATIPYRAACAQMSRQGGLVHQDLAPGNLLVTPKGLRAIDLDAVAVDLPARDLRKLLSRIFVLTRRWDPGLLRLTLVAYAERNPLPRPHWQALYADLLFPHLAVSAVAKYLQTPAAERVAGSSASRSFLRRLEVEESKEEVLGQVFSREGVPCLQ